jgi:hypothetical protein
MTLVYLSRPYGLEKIGRWKPGDKSPGYYHNVPSGDAFNCGRCSSLVIRKGDSIAISLYNPISSCLRS